MNKITTGIEGLDKFLSCGYAKGEMNIMMGKSMVGIPRIRSMIIGIEMSDETIKNRIKKCLKQDKK